MTRLINLSETIDDLAPLQEELQANDECWLLDTSRQTKIACQRDTQTIFLRVAATALAPGIPNASVHPSRVSKVSARFPRTMAWLTEFSTRLNGELGRAMLVRLKPRGQVYRHADEGDYYRVHHRFHVMLDGPEGSWLECGGERRPTRSGDVIWFDNKCPYEECNPSERWSVRLIVDILPPERPPIPSQFKNFALMKAGVDVSPLLAEIDAQPDLWDADTRRQQNIKVQRETSNIPLRGALHPIPAGVNQKNWHLTGRTEYAARCPRIYSWVEQFVSERGGSLARVNVVRLNPHGKVYPHIDDGDYYKIRDRYHLVLRSPGGSEMNSGGEEVIFRDGELWWFNNNAMHDAYNPSDHGRIHVIFDVLPPRPPSEFWPGFDEGKHHPATTAAPETPEGVPERQRALAGERDTPRSVPDTARGGLNATIRAILEGAAPPFAPWPYLEAATGEVQVQLRASGRLVTAGWGTGRDYWEAFYRALESLCAHRNIRQVNELMLCLCGTSQLLSLADPATWQRLESNCQRGLFGYQIALARDPDVVVRISPFEFVATNRSFGKILRNAIEPWGISIEEARAGGITVREFETERFRIDLAKDDAAPTPLVRGTRLVTLEEVTHDYTVRLQRLLADYLIRSVRPDGRMMYLYHPSRGTEDTSRNNAIRQWMATRSLIRIWEQRQSNEVLGMLRRNITYNVKTMYAEEGELGLIQEETKVKLGAVALAALALTESPFADEFALVRERLAKTVDLLWQQDGSFRTFYRPADRDDCQNFYPGEALLFWAKRIVATGDAALLARFQRSVGYYRAWHRDSPNPAFVPWHTQAYCIVWRLRRDRELAETVFTMNDWLLGVQQWETAPHPDCQGRFFDPDRPFGPPHSSSTAVYLEGLADAVALARELGEHGRSDRYRTAIRRGLRSLAQLTFKDDVDMYYVSKRESLRGGVQSSEYDNSVRVDNVQHALTAIDKILKVLAADDYHA